MVTEDLKQQVQTSFKLWGLSVRLDACKYLVGLLEPVDPEQRQGWVERILTQLQEGATLQSTLVDKDTLARAVRDCSNQESGVSTLQALEVISAFDVPRLSYSVERKKYLEDSVQGRDPPSLLAHPDSKSGLFLDRFSLLHQRTARHDLFQARSGQGLGLGPNNQQDKGKRFQLKAVEFLLGTTNRLEDVIVLGMLTQLQPGTYSLEDPSGTVTLDLTQTKFHTGLYTESCFVLAEGWYDDNVFHILALGFPPAESSLTTRAYFGNLNFFGGSLEVSCKANPGLAELESANPDAMFVFLSDVWLDSPQVQDRLRRLFAGYSAMPPTAFVLCGNFLSNPGEQGYVSKLREHLKLLGEMIAEHQELANNSEFLLVPGPADPGSPKILPRPPLPPSLTSELTRLVPKVRLLSNPARVRYCSQEMVILREDILTKLCRNTIYFPETGDIADHFAKTITSQGHLTPLPLHTCPVYWEHDRALSLYPLPDLVVTADKFEAFSGENMGCKVINPSSFAKNEFSFKTYIPASRTVEDSQVPDED